MGLAIYKPGQGYWTRVMSAIGAGTIVVAGVLWLITFMETLPNAVIWQAVTAAVIILTSAAVLYWLLNKPRVADFMIATEGEMKKVNWPTRREIIGSTWVVICGTFLIALLLFLVDLLFGWVFLQIGVLQPQG